MTEEKHLAVQSDQGIFFCKWAVCHDKSCELLIGGYSNNVVCSYADTCVDWLMQQWCLDKSSCDMIGWYSDDVTCSFADTSVTLQTDGKWVSKDASCQHRFLRWPLVHCEFDFVITTAYKRRYVWVEWTKILSEYYRMLWKTCDSLTEGQAN